MSREAPREWYAARSQPAPMEASPPHSPFLQRSQAGLTKLKPVEIPAAAPPRRSPSNQSKPRPSRNRRQSQPPNQPKHQLQSRKKQQFPIPKTPTPKHRNPDPVVPLNPRLIASGAPRFVAAHGMCLVPATGSLNIEPGFYIQATRARCNSVARDLRLAACSLSLTASG